MIKNLRIITSIVIILIIVIPLIEIANVYSQQQFLEEEINIRMDTYGGNVRTSVNIMGEALTNMNVLKAYIPISFYNETTDTIIVRGVNQNDGAFPLEFTLSNTGENYVLEIELKNGVDTVIIDIYQPEEISPIGQGRYSVKILSYLKLNQEVRTTDVQIRPPLDISAIAEELPFGYSQVQVSPEGVTPSQYEISRTLSETDIRILNRTLIDEIPLTQAASGRTSLILADSWVNMTLYPNFDGKLYGEMNLTVKNKDLITWPKDTEIQLNDFYRVTNIQTELGLPIEYEYVGRVYKLKLPYDVRAGDKVIFNIKFLIEENVSLTSDFIPMLNIDVKLPPPTSIPIDRFIVIQSWNNKMIEVDYYMDQSEKIEISGKLNLDIQSLLNQTGISYILFIIFVLTVGLVAYKGLSKVLQEELPEEVKEYLEVFVKEMELMGQVIDLERRHLEGKIRDKWYIKEKSKIQRKIKELRRSSIKSRDTLIKLAEENATLKELLEDIKEVERTYEELNKLEDSRRRRAITLERYKEMRKELITKFEMYSTRVKKRL